MKKLIALCILTSVLLSGIADAGLQGTAWRDSIGTYYLGFSNGTIYSSDDGVVWIGYPGVWTYIDLNGSFFSCMNPFLVFGNFVVSFGTYSITGTSGTLHHFSFMLYFFVPQFITYNMSLIDTDWTPPAESALEQKSNGEIVRKTEALLHTMFFNP